MQIAASALIFYNTESIGIINYRHLVNKTPQSQINLLHLSCSLQLEMSLREQQPPWRSHDTLGISWYDEKTSYWWENTKARWSETGLSQCVIQILQHLITCPMKNEAQNHHVFSCFCDRDDAVSDTATSTVTNIHQIANNSIVIWNNSAKIKNK